jgi:hypothetical protein
MGIDQAHHIGHREPHNLRFDLPRPPHILHGVALQDADIDEVSAEARERKALFTPTRGGKVRLIYTRLYSLPLAIQDKLYRALEYDEAHRPSHTTTDTVPRRT